MLSNSLLTEYKAGNVQFSSTTGYQYLNDDMKMDQDFSPKSIFTLNQLQKQRAASQEFVLKTYPCRNINGLSVCMDFITT